MKRLFLILLITFLNAQEGFSCSCGGDYDASYFENQMESADYIFIGEAIKNVGFHTQRNKQLDTEGIGYNVLFKVDSVIKGDLKGTEVILDQWNDGSCTKTFTIGDKYIIFGIDYKKHWNYEETIKMEEEYKKVEGYGDFTQFDFYAAKEDDYSIINTNYCSAFLKGDDILKYLK